MLCACSVDMIVCVVGEWLSVYRWMLGVFLVSSFVVWVVVYVMLSLVTVWGLFWCVLSCLCSVFGMFVLYSFVICSIWLMFVIGMIFGSIGVLILVVCRWLM